MWYPNGVSDSRSRIILLSCLFAIAIASIAHLSIASNPFHYFGRDKFDEIMMKMDRATPETCKYMSIDELRLDSSTLSQLPQYNKILLQEWFDNRTNLMHMHNMAFNRAYFYSYILQKLNESNEDFPGLPGFQYYYFSAAADVTANPAGINGSAVFWNNHCMYPNWYGIIMKFNTTLPLYGPKAHRKDDYNDEVNWLREPTNYTIILNDLGSGLDHNYTSPQYRNNPWYSDKEMGITFYPDSTKESDSRKKHSYITTIRNALINGEEDKPAKQRAFFGPPTPAVSETGQPVRFTRPYYDCGGTNRWQVSTVSPVVDFMARYSNQTKIRGALFVALSVMDIDFLRIDFNPCPVSLGNDQHGLAGIARCKPSTMCEPLPGFGFKRGGYQCVCLPRHRYPYYQNGPFQGVDIEQATEEEYEKNFDCIPIDWKRKKLSVLGLPRNLERRKRSVDSETEGWSTWLHESTKKVLGSVQSILGWDKRKHQHMVSRYENTAVTPHANETTDAQNLLYKKSPPPKQSDKKDSSDDELKLDVPQHKILSRHKRSLNYRGRLSGFDADKHKAVLDLIKHKNKVSHTNCHTMSKAELEFPSDVIYGVEKQFSVQGRTALRLAHFLSGFYQNYIKGEDYGGLKSDRLLNKDQLFGEVFANTMADFEIYGSGIFFDRQMFRSEDGTHWEAFAPYSYRLRETSANSTEATKSIKSINAIDLAINGYRNYFDEPFFSHLKERWASNTYGLERIVLKPFVRTDVNGTASKKYDNFPIYYHAPRYEDGYWTRPYFDCDGFIKEWVITYAAPFFGFADDQKTSLRFMGVVTTTVRMERLDINQCPTSYYTPNFFKNTAICDYRTTYCTHIPRRHFQVGSYKCECRQGFEMPFDDNLWFFEGQTLEQQYLYKMNGTSNLFDLYRCREGAAGKFELSAILVLSFSLVSSMLILSSA